MQAVKASSKSKVLLLDFDGVVLKACAAHSVVTTRARAFTRKHLREAADAAPATANTKAKVKAADAQTRTQTRTATATTTMTSIRSSARSEVCDALCDALYATYGHTVLGLRALGYTHVTKADFDSYVYRYMDHTYFNEVKTEEVHRLQTRTLLRLVDSCTRAGVDVRLFSNAPDAWCMTALQAMDPRGDLERFFAGHGCAKSMSAMLDGLMKPEAAAYAAIEAAIRSTSQAEKQEIWFVDDQLKNLHPVMNNPLWHKVLVTQGQSQPQLQSQDGIASPMPYGLAAMACNVQDSLRLHTIPELHHLCHICHGRCQTDCVPFYDQC